MSDKDGGPAFARSIGYGTLMVAGERSNLEVSPQAGMTLRDYFAAHSGFPDKHSFGLGDTSVAIDAARAYRWADAMLAERAK